ncbi:uncharacterized protein LOC125801744 [Astyanax mexicanus]|uniref:uncharacterized protein LOC125801744 n=1 Tax=Astyanax mexicanus TaxID=7994 RepID=UPI0020CAE372|nr:uncharacterized protein LOC125801744 [Astyanax mexicanus]
MFQVFMLQQQERDELWRKEAGKQEQRWRSLQHQFTLLQQMTRAESHSADEGGAAAAVPGNSTQILRHSGAAASGREGVQASNQDSFQLLKARPEKHISPWTLDISSYAKVKEAILQKFEINKDTYRQQFRHAHIKPKETPRELHCRLKGLYEKWIRPKEKSKDEIGDAIVLEQFLSVLNPELRRWIIERSPESTARAVELAEAFITARRSDEDFNFSKGRSNQPAEKPGKSDGDFGKCLNAYTKNSNVEGRWQKAKAKTGYGSGYSYSNSRVQQPNTTVKCYNCGQQGHKSRECPAVDRSASKLCYVPKPDRKGEVAPNMDTVITIIIGKRTHKALIDTGASQTLITKQSLPGPQIFHDSKLRVKCVHGDERTYPTTNVKIEIKGQAYMLKVGVVDRLPYDVILGRDVPILLDLLSENSVTASVYAVTRQQTKLSESAENKQRAEQLPFSTACRVRKSKREKRQAKVRGTRVEEQLSVPSLEDPKFPADIGSLQKADETLKILFNRAL